MEGGAWLLSLLLLALGVAAAAAQTTEWGSPKFEKPEDTTDFTYSENLEYPDGIIIALNEHATPVIAIIKYAGEEEVRSSVETALQVRYTRAEDGQTYNMAVTGDYDYDTTDQYRFNWQVVIGSESAQVTVNIQNINDNAPQFTNEERTCEFDENTKGLTKCLITVRDIDGDTDIAELTVNEKSQVSVNFDLVKGEASADKMEQSYQLNVIKELDYETTAVHTLRIVANDDFHDPVEMVYVVEVNDLPDTPPVWDAYLPSLSIEEKKEHTVTVSAKDGDREVDAAISYSANTEEEKHAGYIDMEKETGQLTIHEIDRDTDNVDSFKVVLRAYETENSDSFVEQDLVVIVNDVNDNIPTIEAEKQVVPVPEGFSGTLNFSTITIKDPDLAENGRFTIKLEENDWSSAFMVVPSSGYQMAPVSISVIDPDSLDYEDEKWQVITLKVVTTEVANTSHESSMEFTVNLWDVNDETPVFPEGPLKATHPESLPVGELVTTVVATDKDKDDIIKYSIVPSGQFLVDADTGAVTLGRALDYETAQSVTLQLVAEDKVLHRGYVELVVTVTDVNDESPTIDVDGAILDVDEALDNVEVVTTISTTDPDTDADLEIDIDWDTSRATKLGVRLPDASKTLYSDCFNIALLDGKGGLVKANLVTSDNKKLSWGDVDTIYLVLRVTDRATNEDYWDSKSQSTVQLTITVKDINDHEPVFRDVSELRVPEELENIMIGTVLADDEDGPGNNDITYSLSVKNPLYEGYVEIDEKTGDLKTIKKIDCDADEFDRVELTVWASDIVHNTTKDIRIEITDTNDNDPQFTDFEREGTVKERSEDDKLVMTIQATDKDRSVPYHTLAYFMDSSEINSLFFKLDRVSGELRVRVAEGHQLIREEYEEFSIGITVWDNYEGSDIRHSAQTTVTVRLEDINDNKPTFPEREEVEVEGCFPPSNGVSISEYTKKDIVVGKVHADDSDDGENARVDYSITSVTDLKTGEELDELLFAVDQATGDVKAAVDLLDKWGKYDVLFEGTDNGVPERLQGTVTYTFCIIDENNHDPVIAYPTDGQRLKIRETQVVGEELYDSSNEPLQEFVASDEDDVDTGNGKVSMTVTGADNATFSLVFLKTNTYRLILNQPLSDAGKSNFELTILAEDNGTPKRQHSVTITVAVLTITEKEPIFAEGVTCSLEFPENITGTGQEREIPEAEDPNNENNDEEDEIFYFLTDEDDDNLFVLDKSSRMLKLVGELDYETTKTHTRYIVATNNQQKPEQVPIKNNPSVVECTILVTDENDMPPEFTKDLFAGGFSDESKIGDIVLRLEALDPDVDDEVTYEMIGAITASSDSLSSYKEKAVAVGADGSVILNFQPKKGTSLDGYFSFMARAKDKKGDEEGHFRDTDVQVYVISNDHRVNFLFLNTVDDIEEQQSQIQQIFTDVFKYECGIETVRQSADNSGVALDDTTQVTAHFIDTAKNLPVARDDITRKMYEQETFRTLQSRFWTELDLDLKSYEEAGSGGSNNIEGLLTIILIVVSAVLGTMVVVLFAAFFLRTRTLNRRLKAFSQTKFGSQESGLNRAGVAIPNTNKHAVEGANPMWGTPTVIDYDNVSQGSGDSDLIGIEDNPEFQPNKKNAHFLDSPQPRKLTGILNDNFTFHPKDPDDVHSTENGFLSPEDKQPRRITETLNKNFILQPESGENDSNERKQSVNPLASGKLNSTVDFEGNNNFSFKPAGPVPVTQL